MTKLIRTGSKIPPKKKIMRNTIVTPLEFVTKYTSNFPRAVLSSKVPFDRPALAWGAYITKKHIMANGSELVWQMVVINLAWQTVSNSRGKR